jgi:hypothetical protein
MYLISSVKFFPEDVHCTEAAHGFTLQTTVALLQNGKSGETYISRISNFCSGIYKQT